MNSSGPPMYAEGSWPPALKFRPQPIAILIIEALSKVPTRTGKGLASQEEIFLAILLKMGNLCMGYGRVSLVRFTDPSAW